MPTQSVRTHQRKNADGSTTTVHQHKRSGMGGRGRKKNAARSGWNNLKKAYKYGRRKKRAAAIFCGVLGTAQIGSFVALRGVSLAAASVAIIATAVAGLAYAASSGGKLPQ
ncbi:hypothetical protein ACI2LF_43750 [Kribbella sp. NPDC020789]